MKQIHCVAGIFFCLIISARNREPKLLPNTEEYSKAHGIVEGRANELRVKGVLFRFPAQYVPIPYTDGEAIVKGQTDRIRVIFHRPSWVRNPAIAPGPGNGAVRIEVSKYGYENEEILDRRFKQIKWRSIEDKVDLGLREYIDTSPGGWGHWTYEGLDPNIKTPRGGRIIFSCSGVPSTGPNQCRTSYQHPRGLSVEYFLEFDLMPRWREVHSAVVQLVDSWITQ